MWRYLSNVEPPRKKAKSGENQSAERFKQYDKQTRQRKFQSAWKKDDQGREREWLVFDDEMESMFCIACRTFAKTDQDKKGPFVVSTNKFKLENIKAHELSKSHIFFKTCFDNQNKPVADTQAGVCVQQLTSAQRENVTKLMRNAHAVVKHCAPFTHYELMCK